MSADQFTAGGVFRVGDVLGRAWRLLIRNLLFFLAAPVLIYGAMVAAFWAVGSLTNVVGGAALPMAGIIVLTAILVLAVNMVGQGVLLLGAFQRLRGEPLRIGAALRRALARVFPLLGLAILWSLGIGACLLLSVVAVSLGLWGIGSGVAVFLAVLALPVCLVPAAILFVMWAVVVPACVIEGLGPIVSLLRSAALTKGYRWKIFGIMIPLGLASFAGNIIGVLAGTVSATLAIGAEAAWLVVLIAYWHCTIIMTYHDLRVAKEGIDTAQIASIFD